MIPGLLFTLLIFVVVCVVVWWVFTLLSGKLPEPVRTIVMVVIVILMLVWFLDIVMPLSNFGGGHLFSR
jgi:hypothetical protein